MKYLIKYLSLFIPGSSRRKMFRGWFRYSPEMRPHILNSLTMRDQYRSQKKELQDFVDAKCAESTSESWCASGNCIWKYANPTTPTKILEIGSWKGGSAVAFNYLFPQATITCIDAWDKSDELENAPAAERHFDKNTADFAAKLRKIKSYSLPALSKLIAAGESFDFIFIDGSHYEDDVAVDSYLAWELLEVGGVLVWDDYLWNLADYAGHNPKPAIDRFINRHRADLEILSVYPQPIVRKLK